MLPLLAPQLEIFKSKGVVVWGTGSSALAMMRFFSDFNLTECVRGFCDSFTKDNSNRTFCNLPLYSAAESAKLYPDAVYVVASNYFARIKKFVAESVSLKGLNLFCMSSDKNSPNYLVFIYSHLFLRHFSAKPSIICNYCEFFDHYTSVSEKMLEQSYDMLEDEESRAVLKGRIRFFQTGSIEILKSIPIYNGREYFGVFQNCLREDEIYLDCGTFNGDSVLSFLAACGSKYKGIYAFEPNLKSFTALSRMSEKRNIKNIQCFNYAVGEQEGLCCCVGEDAGCSVTQAGDDGDTVRQICLDSYCKIHPTFIKMDIEGGEADALRGGKRIIGEAHHLKCAICSYHSDDDEVVISNLLENYGMSCTTTEGYMWYPYCVKGRFPSDKLHRGIVRGEK